MLLANYDSDSGSDSEGSGSGPASGPSKTTRQPAPPPRAAVGLPPTAPSAVKPAVKPKRKGPVKITLDLPKGSQNDTEGGEEEEADEGMPEMKKQKVVKGKGSSALLGMLPPPKRKTPGSGLGPGSTGSRSGLSVNKSMAKPPPPPGEADLSSIIGPSATGVSDDDEEESGMMLPRGVAKGRKKEEPTMDLFGLSSAPTPAPATVNSTTLKPPTISSAPLAPDYVPPAPTPQDPYPGYYQTPSGTWHAYDPAYYASFFPSSSAPLLQGEKSELDEGDGRVGHHWDEYDTKGADVVEVDVSADIARARKEQERKELMKKPKAQDEFEYKAIGQIKGVAAQRHQLTSLLHTAYSSREELEERIAANKKNMRLAGQKYGF